MEHKEKDIQIYYALQALIAIPKQLIYIHGLDNTAEFLLHDLCQKRCLNFLKAAYFVDNPHFDLLKGVAGFSSEESYPHDNHWHDQVAFSEHMNNSIFNKKVRSLGKNSIKNFHEQEQEIIHELSQELAFDHPQYLIWPIKYENHGLLLFDSGAEDKAVEEHVHHALYLFSFCPVF